jgi:hypothetical protein
MLAASPYSSPLPQEDTSSGRATLIVVILACAIVAISMLLYLLHWCRQKRKASRVDARDDRDSISGRTTEGESVW